MNLTCPICGGPMTSMVITRMGSLENVSMPAHLCPGPNAQASMAGEDFSKHLNALRNWKVTLHGRLDGTREPVPQPFQDAFKDGELEV